MAGINRVLTVLYEIRAAPHRFQMKIPEFEAAMASLESHYEKHRPKLREFYEDMAAAHGSAHELNRIAEDLENWQRAHFPAF